MVTVHVNPSCELYWEGARYGAGAGVQMPVAIAHQKEKEGVVTIVGAPKKQHVVTKEKNHDGT